MTIDRRRFLHLAALGALVATIAVVSRSFPLLLLGTVLIGWLVTLWAPSLVLMKWALTCIGLIALRLSARLNRTQAMPFSTS